jgi:hypothetical protein
MAQSLKLLKQLIEGASNLIKEILSATTKCICAIGVRRKASLNSGNAVQLLSQLDIYY